MSASNVLIKANNELNKKIQIAQQIREKLNHMHLKAGQRKWQYERALKLADEFDSMASEKTRIAFWSRENVIRAIDKGDAKDMMYWLESKIWLLEQGIGETHG